MLMLCFAVIFFDLAVTSFTLRFAVFLLGVLCARAGVCVRACVRVCVCVCVRVCGAAGGGGGGGVRLVI
jgi:hypothetical protein